MASTTFFAKTLLLLLCCGAALSATLTCDGEVYTADQLTDFDPAAMDVPNQYIVITNSTTDNTAVLASLSPWTPTTIYESSFPGFAGTMNVTQLEMLLEDERVTSMECDTAVMISSETSGATLTCDGEVYTADQLADFDPAAMDLPNEYIVMTNSTTDNTAVLASLSPWTATTIYESIAGFAGTMDVTQLEMLLEDDRVTFVECDVIISATTSSGVSLSLFPAFSLPLFWVLNNMA